MSEAPAAPAAYNYSSQKGPSAIQAGVLVLMVYALLDTYFLNAYTYMQTPPWAVFAGVGVLALIASALVAREAPLRERAVVCLMFAAAAAGAAYPLTLRANQWTDSDGPEVAVYRYAGEQRFKAEDTSLPDLDFSNSPDAWPLNAGDAYNFEVVRGSLGFAQLNLMRLRSETKSSRVRITPVPASGA